MKSHIRYIICFLLILAWSISSHAFEQQDSSKTQFTILKAKGYVDVRNGKLIKPANIVMQQGLIKSINPKKLPDNSNVINLESMIILPGLIDVHTHLMIGGSNISSGDDLIRQARENSETDFVLGAMENGYKTLQAGFTTVRDLDSWYFVDVTLSKISQKKWSALPRIIPAGHGINKSSPADYSHLFPKVDSLPVVGIADNKSQLIEAVDAQYKAGARVIKLYATVGVTMADFMKKPIGAPMYTQEEMNSVMDEASKLGMKVAVHSHGANASMTAVLAGAASIEHGSVLTDKVIEEMKKRGVYLVPTTPVINKRSLESGHLSEKSAFIVKEGIKSHKRAISAGVKIAYGSDAGIYPHGKNADGFADLVAYGMSETEAIKTATINAADLIGVNDRGVIETGKLADLIAVEGNPLDDILLLQDVRFVMKDGRIFKNLAR